MVLSNRTNYLCKQMTDVKLWLFYTNTWNYLKPRRLHLLNTLTASLRRSETPLASTSFLDITQSDGEAPALEICGMWCIPSLPLLPCPLWPGVVAPDRVLSIVQIEQTVCKQMTEVKRDSYISILETICVQKRAQARFKMFSTKCVHKPYIYMYVCVRARVCVSNIWH